MKIEGEWCAKVSPENTKQGDLVDLAGRWNAGVDVHIVNPFVHSTGPIEYTEQKH
jgi:hypothetical protein